MTDDKETPFLGDITVEDTREIGETIRNLTEGDTVRVTNHRLDFYIKGEVEKKENRIDGEEFYRAIIRFGRTKAEIHANWRDIQPHKDDQKTPYTGLLIEPFNDTSPPVTDIEVV